MHARWGRQLRPPAGQHTSWLGFKPPPRELYVFDVAHLVVWPLRNTSPPAIPPVEGVLLYLIGSQVRARVVVGEQRCEVTFSPRPSLVQHLLRDEARRRVFRSMGD